MNPTPLEVLPYDGVFRCLVRSAKNPKRVYLVDLEANHGCAFCGCWQWQYRLAPQIAKLTPKQRRENAHRYFCKHVKAARAIRAEQLLDEILKQRAEKARKL